MTESASEAEMPRLRWFDNGNPNLVSRFLSSDAVRTIVTALAVAVAVWALKTSSRNQELAINAQSRNQEKAIHEQFLMQQDQIKFQDEIYANQAWISYRDLAEKNPFFDYGKVDFDSLSRSQKVHYYALFERLLMSADIVSIKAKNDLQWQDAFAMEFLKHKKYIIRPAFLEARDGHMSDYCSYRDGVRVWLRNALRLDRNASGLLAKAEAECDEYQSKAGFKEDA